MDSLYNLKTKKERISEYVVLSEKSEFKCSLLFFSNSPSCNLHPNIENLVHHVYICMCLLE